MEHSDYQWLQKEEKNLRKLLNRNKDGLTSLQCNAWICTTDVETAFFRKQMLDLITEVNDQGRVVLKSAPFH